MDTYKPGLVSALLFASTEKAVPKNDALSRLFSTKPPVKHSPVPQTMSLTILSNGKNLPVSKNAKNSSLLTEAAQKENKKQKKARRKSEGRQVKEDNAEKITALTSPVPYIHETLLQPNQEGASPSKSTKRKMEKDQEDNEENLGKRPRRDRVRNKESDKRTVFIGNCPLTADRKKLKKLFREFGEIETIRFRCAPAAEPNLPRRATTITKNFHEQCNNFVSYVVFKEEEAAKKALTRNGFMLDGLHLRVDIAAMAKRHDKKRSVFVGNLPFTIGEEAIRSHFSDCGDITNIRIVRDRATSLGKGICYVQFESKDSVGLALKLNMSELEGRQIRVMVCVNKLKKREETAVKKGKNSDKSGKPRSKKMTFAPSNVTSSKFQTILKMKKNKRFRKMKKKKEQSKKQDGLSSIFGDMPSSSKQAKFRKVKGDTRRKFSHKSSGTSRKSFHKGSSAKGKGKGKAKTKH